MRAIISKLLKRKAIPLFLKPWRTSWRTAGPHRSETTSKRWKEKLNIRLFDQYFTLKGIADSSYHHLWSDRACVHISFYTSSPSWTQTGDLVMAALKGETWCLSEDLFAMHCFVSNFPSWITAREQASISDQPRADAQNGMWSASAGKKQNNVTDTGADAAPTWMGGWAGV